MAFDILRGFQHVQQQADEGRARGERTALGKLMGQAYTAAPEARTGLYAQMAQIDPQAALATDQAFTARDDAKQKRQAELLAQGAGWMADMSPEMRAQAYPVFRQRAMSADPEFGAMLPEQYDDAQMGPLIARIAGGGADVPAGYQEFDLLTKAGGLSAEDRAKAARVRLGLDGRASSAGFGFDMVEDAYGNPRPQRRNPRDGSVEVFHAESSQWVPLGRASAPAPAYGAPAPLPAGGDIFAGLKQAVPGLRITSELRTPEENAALPNAVPNSYHLTGQAIDIGRPSPEQQQQITAWLQSPEGSNFELIRNYSDGHWHIEPRPGRAPVAAGGVISPQGYGGGGSGTNAPVAAPALGLGRSKEAETAAVEQAKIGTQLANAPAVTGMEAERERLKKEAQLEAERNAAGEKRSAQAQDSIGTLNEVIALLPDATASSGGAARDALLATVGLSTQGAQNAAQLRLLSAKLIANVPRFEGPQSNIDVQFYREAAGDLANERLPSETRLAAARKMLEIAERYAKSGAPSPAPAAGGWGIQRVTP